MTVCSPWQWFCSTRTLSNCLETSLTIAGLSLWPWHWSSKEAWDEGIQKRACIQTAGKPGSRNELTRCVGCFFFSFFLRYEIHSVDSVGKTSALLAFSISGLCFAANESPNMGLHCLLYRTPQPISVNFGGETIAGCHFPKVWKSASARGNLMRVNAPPPLF